MSLDLTEVLIDEDPPDLEDPSPHLIMIRDLYTTVLYSTVSCHGYVDSVSGDPHLLTRLHRHADMYEDIITISSQDDEVCHGMDVTTQKPTFRSHIVYVITVDVFQLIRMLDMDRVRLCPNTWTQIAAIASGFGVKTPRSKSIHVPEINIGDYTPRYLDHINPIREPDQPITYDWMGSDPQIPPYYRWMNVLKDALYRIGWTEQYIQPTLKHVMFKSIPPGSMVHTIGVPGILSYPQYKIYEYFDQRVEKHDLMMTLLTQGAMVSRVDQMAWDELDQSLIRVIESKAPVKVNVSGPTDNSIASRPHGVFEFPLQGLDDLTLEDHTFKNAVYHLHVALKTQPQGVSPRVLSFLSEWCQSWLYVADVSVTKQILTKLNLWARLKTIEKGSYT